jgi:hypothetical protein
MGRRQIGVVGALWRYPVKSMRGEALPIASITQRGVAGDRAWALREGAYGGLVSQPLRLKVLQSLLDQMIGLIEKPWSLDWHYRSLDESLIAFSNRHIYGDRLITFPGTGGPPALSHVLVPFVPDQAQQERMAALQRQADAEATERRTLKIIGKSAACAVSILDLRVYF